MTTQEGEAPDLRLAIAVTLILLDDVWAHLDVGTDDGLDVADILLRIAALRSVLRRVQQGLRP